MSAPRTGLLREGAVLFITAATGIGAAAARLAAADGARLFVICRSADAGQALRDSLGDAAEIGFATADLTRADETEAAFAAGLERCGRIDALFNVAGISGRRFGDGPIHECTEEGWDVTLDTNTRSMFLCCRAALNAMLAQEPGPNGLRGSILNMASVLAYSPQRDHFATHAYAASKGAILGMTRSMAGYYAPHKIRVNAVAPSLVRTPMSLRAQDDPAILALMQRKQPLVEDLIDAGDVARAALFLLGDHAHAITGDILAVDAGWGVS